MRASPFGLNPAAFFTAVTQMGPQRLYDRDSWDGGLLVVSKVVGQTGTYVCLSDHTYVPTLVNFTTTLGRAHVLDPITDQPATPLDVVQARPFYVEDLIQRLAEFAVENKTPITDDLVAAAVNLWFNAGLIRPASAVHQLKGAYVAHHFDDENVQRLFDAAASDDDLRSLTMRMVSDIAKKAVHGYTQQI